MSATDPVVRPAKLFKYRNWPGYTRSIFTDSTIYLASPFDFNDPFDCGLEVLCAGGSNQKVIEAIAFRQVCEKLPHLALEDKLEAAKQVGCEIALNHLAEVAQTGRQKVVEEITSRCGIFCLSEVNDDLLMWSHYADCHKGICLEFSVGDTIQPFCNVRPVRYSDEMPKIDLHELVTNEDLRRTASWMLTKATAWAYEKEWRLLEFNAGPGPLSFDASALTGVIFGCRLEKAERQQVMETIRSAGLTPSFLEARMATDRFKLHIVPV